MNKSVDPGDEKALRVAYLIAGYIRQTLSPAEHAELDAWVEASDENMLLFEELTDEKKMEEGLQRMEEADSTYAYQRIKSKIPFTKERKTKTIWPYAIAAAVLLAIGGLYLFKVFNSKPDQPIAIQQTRSADIAPGSNKAVLVLANGSKIILDSAPNGALAVEGNTQILKNDSALSYNDKAQVGIKQEVVYNTLSTPKGGQYSLTLADGTKAWLNAASSIYFPTAFTGNERVVAITGEVYFEVAKDFKRPFHVKTVTQDITVLGTHFNINAYDVMNAIRTTLLEGSVLVTSGGSSLKLKPGQQSITNRGGGYHPSHII